MLKLNVEYLAEVMNQKGIRVSEFCTDYLGISRSTYYHWIDEPYKVRMADAQMIADALRIPVMDIILE